MPLSAIARSVARFAFSLSLILGVIVVGARGADEEVSAGEVPAGKVDFNRDVRPILSEYCYACHGFDANHREAGLRLDTFEGATEELSSGEHAIQPGDPEASELVRRLLAEDEYERMPPPDSGKSLSEEQIALIQQWIASGAEYDSHWAFSAPVKPTPPADTISKSDWNNPIDAFIHETLQKRGLAPSGSADPATLIRRVSLDLIGLPPTVEETEAFEKDYSLRGSVAFRELVDRLLDSPHYGERWGRWWLDQARYADSNGYSIDSPRSIWLYRDWVVQAFNNDMPFEQFTIEQLAGDLLPDATESQRIASGFHRNTQINQEGGIDPEQFRIESVFDRVATTGSVFLGLTVGCAQCHDHKFDPITQKEYYELFAFYNNQDEPDIRVYPPEINPSALEAKKRSVEAEIKSKLDAAVEEISRWEEGLDETTKETLPKGVKDALKLDKAKRSLQHRSNLFAAMRRANGGDAKAMDPLLKNLKEIDQELAKGIPTMVLRERKEPRKSWVYIQGDFTRPDEEVTPGTLSILHPFPELDRYPNRLDLAKWIVAPENPITSRVLVNRVWQVYFGRGIVETENDFGLQSAVPSHPELLDWLATDWRENGMSFKKLHRQIVCSDVYTRSSKGREDLVDIDRDNYLLARQHRLRLDAELVRDVGLAASGLLTRKVGGAPVFPPIPDGVMSQGQVKREWKTSSGEDRYRRGLYTFMYRATPAPSLNVFDAPEGNATCTRRNRSNTPLQALTLLNDTAFFEFAQALAKIVEEEGVEAAFQRCTSRKPTPEECSILSELPPLSVARVLLNLDETVTRE